MSKPEPPVVRQITFDETSVSIQYMVLPDDVRADGRLLATHVLTIARSADYDDGIEAVTEVALELLADAREDFARTDPVEIDLTDDHDDNEEDDE